MKPLTGWPQGILPLLQRRVARVANAISVAKFYIGRGRDAHERKRYHGADDVIPLYLTTSVVLSMDVEDYLINRFYDHPKCDNDASHAGGGISQGSEHFVYVAIWYLRMRPYRRNR